MKNIKRILNYLATKWLHNRITGLYSLIDVFAGFGGFGGFGSAAATPAIVEIYVSIADDIAIWK